MKQGFPGVSAGAAAMQAGVVCFKNARPAYTVGAICSAYVFTFRFIRLGKSIHIFIAHLSPSFDARSGFWTALALYVLEAVCP
jgi:hypothetical protein